MAGNELAIRFTENTYATKNEVSKELKMSLIDNIWNNILSYRSYFNRYLTIKSIEKNALLLCVCPTIGNAITSLDGKLLRLARDYGKLTAESGDLGYFENKCFNMAMNVVAKINDLDVDEIYLRSLLNGELKNIDFSHQILANYAKALMFIKDKAMSPIDVDYLAELYSILTNNPNLTSFYRTEEDRNRENRVIIDRIYTAAPTANIETMMDSLFSFISTSTLSASVKALTTYYYVSYIKPFPKYSDEVALLLAKAVLTKYDLGGLGSFIPLESLLSEDLQVTSRIFVEVQKTNDITYFVNYGIKFVDKKCDELLDILANREAQNLRKDFYREEVPAPVVEETPVEEAAPVVEEVKEEPVQEKEVTVEVKPTPAPIPTQRVVEEKVVVRQEVREEIAVGYIPPVLDEKAAARLEEHLLELDPSMKRGEAHFYARHCTIGKRYTIQQYKKSIGCAYETARTSMDHLVAMGYYRKEMVKNKNVYTPIPRN